MIGGYFNLWNLTCSNSNTSTDNLFRRFTVNSFIKKLGAQTEIISLSDLYVPRKKCGLTAEWFDQPQISVREIWLLPQGHVALNEKATALSLKYMGFCKIYSNFSKHERVKECYQLQEIDLRMGSVFKKVRSLNTVSECFLRNTCTWIKVILYIYFGNILSLERKLYTKYFYRKKGIEAKSTNPTLPN